MKRQAGVGLHITSLPGPYGIGELGVHARLFIDHMTRMQLSVWQFLPTGPTAYGDSPYQALSTFAGNEMLIDIDDLVQLRLLEASELSELKALPAHFVDYAALIPLKNRVLRLAAHRFTHVANKELRVEFEEFLSRNDSAWLHDYAVFRALKTLHGEKPWPEWSPKYRDRNRAALSVIEKSESDPIIAIKILQFLFFRQWTALRQYAHENGVTLFGDLPIYIALDSADAWANREILKLDEHGRPDSVAGVPPDFFSKDGQLWGNPLYDWAFHGANGYAWWIKRLKASSALADMVRIDHFRGFESFWTVSADAETARNGAWMPGPGDDLFDAIRMALGTLPIVAEDLGVITPEVEGLRDRHLLPGMRVLQFEICNVDFDLADIGNNSVCYTGTHDNDTTVGWFRGDRGDIRSQQVIDETQEAVLRRVGGTAATIHTHLIMAAFSTNAFLAMAPLQDYLGLGSDARMNTPGISGGNWRWRVLEPQLTPDFCDTIASMVVTAERQFK